MKYFSNTLNVMLSVKFIFNLILKHECRKTEGICNHCGCIIGSMTYNDHFSCVATNHLNNCIKSKIYQMFEAEI